jgi:N-methylhydantoinase A/oxoprolinase/acetone carboxylase beta subunit
MDCIEKGAKGFGYCGRDLLKKTKSVQLRAPEIVSDTFKNRSGARVGLVITEGYEKNVYFEGNGENPTVGSVVAKEMIVGLAEETSGMGERVRKPHEEEVKDKVRYLLEFGGIIIAISLKNAPFNPANEGLVKEIIESDYPRHYLGAVPILLSSDFSHEGDDFLRTSICLMNAYIWFDLDHFLRRVEALLQQNGYNFTLQVSQADRKTVLIHRVTPLKTCTSDQTAFVRSMYK